MARIKEPWVLKFKFLMAVKFASVLAIGITLLSAPYVFSSTGARSQVGRDKVSSFLWTRELGYSTLMNCREERPQQIRLQVHVPAELSADTKSAEPALVWNLSPHSTSGKVPVNFLHQDVGVEKLISVGRLKELREFVLVPRKVNLPESQRQYWQVLVEDGSYVVQFCSSGTVAGEYMMFRLINPETMKVQSKVGVRLQDMGVFNRFRLMTAGEVMLPEDELLEEPVLQSSFKKIAFEADEPVPEETLKVKSSSGNVSFGPSPATKSASRKVKMSAKKKSDPRPSGKKVAVYFGGVSNTEKPTGSSLEKIVCSGAKPLNVRDDSFRRVIFKVRNHAPVRAYQEWSQERTRRKISGQTYAFIKVQFPERPFGSDMGWVAENFVKTKSDCSSYRGSGGSSRPGAVSFEEPNSPRIDTAKTSSPGGISFGELDSLFPTMGRPYASYKEGARMFGASRSQGRLHAGVDLHRERGEEVRATADGIVIRDKYYFYEGTYAIEVMQNDGSVVLYGEVQGRTAPGTRAGQKLSAGQTVGYVGKVDSGCCAPMLHFEMYSGSASGPLTNRNSSNRYRRRSDLMNPTTQVSNWERRTFGASY